MRSLITKTRLWVATRKHQEHGANMAEYSLLVSLIALAALGGVAALGGLVPNLFTIVI